MATGTIALLFDRDGGLLRCVRRVRALPPWWAGDHIGIAPAGFLFVYGPDCIIWLALANVAYEIARFAERVAKPIDSARFRRRALVGIAAFFSTLPTLVLAAGVVAAWRGHRWRPWP